MKTRIRLKALAPAPTERTTGRSWRGGGRSRPTVADTAKTTTPALAARSTANHFGSADSSPVFMIGQFEPEDEHGGSGPS